MSPWLDAFVPAFGLLLLGAVLRHRLLREEAVWAGIERLIYWVLLPCLLASALSAVDLRALPLAGMGLAVWSALLLGTGASLLLSRAFGLGHPAATSVLQGGIRFNNLMGFAVAGAVYGTPGLALGAVATGLIVPMVQVIVTLAFAIGTGRGRPSPLALARQVLLNPLILGCAAGFLLSAAGGLPPGLGPTARALGQASVALGLLAVGAALGARALGDRLPLQLAVSAWKLLAMPALTWTAARMLGLDPLSASVVTLFMAQPTAATSYVMARMLGGDAPLMAALTTTQHGLAALTLPLWVLWLPA